MPTKHDHSVAAIVTGGRTVNSLGVIRGLGRHGIPVIYLDSKPSSFVRYSRYIKQHLKCQSTKQSEAKLIEALLDYGKRMNNKMVIIPTSDRDVLALSKHKQELDQFYRLPVPNFDIVQNLVNKRRLYTLLAEMQVPHPRTYFPESLSEIPLMSRQISRNYIIKPVYTAPFQAEFGQKGEEL